MRRLPQVLINVEVADRDAVAGSPTRCGPRSPRSKQTLGDDGRVLLRPSGTEPLVRVMVEADTQQLAQQLAGQVAEVVAAS